MEQMIAGNMTVTPGSSVLPPALSLAGQLPLLMLTGLGRNGLREWVFLPKGWDVQALQRRFRFSGTARSRTRQCLATPASVLELVGMYGEASLTPHLPATRLKARLSHTVIAVELTVLKDAAAIAEAITDARAS